MHKSHTRGHVNYGWLDSHHSFSFGRYYDPDREQFGKLRVLNDDIVVGGAGFGTHPHNNMEIVSIPLQGAIEHQDSMGTRGVIQTGDVQIMSAGSGITHSEYNQSATEAVNFLQIWVLPRQKNIKPRYAQKSYDLGQSLNQWNTVVAPDHPDALRINQDAYFQLATLEKGKTLSYELKNFQHGVYLFVIEGRIKVGDITLDKRDGAGFYDLQHLTVESEEKTYLLLIEVPMA